ncbi:MAG: YlxR family protein [Candidatus Melainabacteria bacterium]|nr:YlxR family protein [Candidatus Melainabacteria bacterium]
MDSVRLCVGCRQEKPVALLHRITWSQSLEQWSLNQQPFCSGRSVYVCRQDGCVESALASQGKRLHRALKRTLPDDIVKALAYAQHQYGVAKQGTENACLPQK